MAKNFVLPRVHGTVSFDGDGKISEEEWAAAEMGENKQSDEKEWWGVEE